MKIKNPPALPPIVYHKMSVDCCPVEPTDTRSATWDKIYIFHSEDKNEKKKNTGWNPVNQYSTKWMESSVIYVYYIQRSVNWGASCR